MCSPPASSSTCRIWAVPRRSESLTCRCERWSASKGIEAAECAAAQRRPELAHQQAQFELAKLGEDGADPAVDLGRPARPLGHIAAEREARPVDDAAHDRR